ncbi:MAG: B12-binding domain-containing radical SAM protein, partial [Spirochaetaceae bacterium]|nr:B12-binding domain-containing radical SAM protein [Spirochaetaceae bacterium]
MKRITFLSLHVEDSPEAQALGAASVAAALLARGGDHPAYEPRLVEGLASEGAGVLAARVLATRPEAVGFSVYA